MFNPHFHLCHHIRRPRPSVYIVMDTLLLYKNIIGDNLGTFEKFFYDIVKPSTSMSSRFVVETYGTNCLVWIKSIQASQQTP